jgi:predicted metal-dependent enzyme (double-stranded beta helix superfamily)
MSPSPEPSRPPEGAGPLIDKVRQAVLLGTVNATADRVKDDLTQLLAEGGLRLEARFRGVRPEGYARRLLWRDPELGFTAVVMTWAPGQRTPLHDHAGIWCVEGVVEGEMEVVRYELLAESGDSCRFAERGRVVAGIGSSGALIPPFEYHTLGNALDERPSLTLHVYGGEMDHCSVFEPQPDGTYRRRAKALGYSD